MIYLYLGIFLLLIIITGGILFIKKRLDRDKVRVFVVKSDRRMTHFKVKPKGETITVGTHTFNINEEDLLLINNIPTYIFHEKNTQPINLITGQRSDVSPSQYRTAIENRLVDEIYKASKKNKTDNNTLVMILLFGIIGALGIVAYLGYGMLEGLIEKINLIVDALKTIGVEV